jgi:hypothetical protein
MDRSTTAMLEDMRPAGVARPDHILEQRQSRGADRIPPGPFARDPRIVPAELPG